MDTAGPELLRALRTRRGLTQAGLAEAAGVHVRTVRGLELGAIVSPRRSTIDLLAHALGSDVGEHLLLRSAWGIVEGRTPVAPDRAPQGRRDRVELIEERLRVSNAALTTVVLDERATIGVDRRLSRRVTQEVVLAAVDGVSTHVVFYDPMDDTVDVANLTLTDVENGVVVSEFVDGSGSAKVFEVGLGRVLARGDTHVLRYAVDFAGARRETSTPRPTSGEEIVGFVRPPSSCVLQVTFTAGALPDRCWRIYQERPTAPFREVGLLQPNSAGHLHLALVDPKPGGHGIAWSWDDAPA